MLQVRKFSRQEWQHLHGNMQRNVQPTSKWHNLPQALIPTHKQTRIFRIKVNRRNLATQTARHDIRDCS